MAILYDGMGNPIELGGSATSDFSVENYGIFEDNTGVARQAILTYQGKRLYPFNYPAQRVDVIKNYGSGVMITLGDSYTAYMNSLFDTFAQRHGLVQDNRGLASSTIAGSEDGITVGYRPFWVRLDEAIAQYQASGGYTIDDNSYTVDDVKLVTVMGGANDWSTVNSTINRLGEGPNTTNKEQLYGACNYIFAKILSTFPNADVVCILQPVNYASSLPSDDTSAQNVGFDNLAQVQQMTVEQYSTYLMQRKERIVREMAEQYGIPLCDCCFEWYNPNNEEDAINYWQSDKLHLTAVGHQAIIDALENVVNNLPFTRN